MNTNPYSGPVGCRVTIVDQRGNAVHLEIGEQISGSPDGKWIQVKDQAGAPTGLRLDGAHNPTTHSDRRARQPHAHVPGITNEDGTPWLPVK